MNIGKSPFFILLPNICVLKDVSPHLLEEVNIVKPKIIVAVGRKAYNVLRRCNELKAKGFCKGYNLKWIPYYSYAFGRS